MANLAQRMESERFKYPALLPDEVLVLRAWLRLHESEYDSFDYNVRIGQGIDPGPTFSPEVRMGNIQNTQLRLDALAMKHGIPTIIEVKRRGGPSNVGQLLTYGAIWRKDHPGGPEPKLMLICSGCAPNILPIVKESGIDLQSVVVDFQGLRGTAT